MTDIRKYWWQENPSEIYWCEITGREDIGGDLNCPQSDEAGKPYWSYSLIKLIQPGDIVFHYSTTQRAFVGASTATEYAREGMIQWIPHGTVGRRKVSSIKSRPAWRLHLHPFVKSASPLTLDAVQRDESWVREWIETRNSEKPLFVPFQPYPKRLRAYQGYLTKMPATFVERWSPLQELAAKLKEEIRSTNNLELDTDQTLAILSQETGLGQRGQGFLVSPKLRKVVEDYAVKIAKQHFESAGYKVEVFGKPYDLLCSNQEKTLYVEVKGTTTPGLFVLLTPNELTFARAHKEQMILFVVHSIDIATDELEHTASGGQVRLIQPWDIDIGELQPLGYSYSIPQ